jgi:hypothetical protein
MIRFIRPRLRKPLLRGIALLGIAAAWEGGRRGRARQVLTPPSARAARG